MKTIKDHADDLRTMASMLIDTANSLETMAGDQAQAVLKALGVLSSTDPKVVKSKHPVPVKRTLSSDEKLVLRNEYQQLPPEERTMETRMILARKWQITPQAVFLLTLSEEQLKERVSNAAKSRHLKSSATAS